ncbi:MAG: DUF6198 family protein [Clostridiales bacterium]|nr:DUF6198 family protein [Clostridiales bacterium]
MKGNRRGIIKRYIVFFCGLLVNSFGVAFITKASLGTTPISSIPYSMSLIFPALTLGNWVMIFNFTMIVLQLILLHRLDVLDLVLQILIAIFYGYFIDLSMLCLGQFMPRTYAVKIVALLLGSAILAMGAYLEVIANVVMIPGDAFMRAVAKLSHREYGTIRVICDVTMTAIAAVLCLVFLRQLSGVREGTIIAAVLTGNIVKLYKKGLCRFERLVQK